MTDQADPRPADGPVVIPPPPPVRAAGLAVLAEAAGLVVLAVVTVTSGVANASPMSQTLAQGGYYLILAGLVAACGAAVLRGRRWGRTPSFLVQVVLLAIGVWVAFPSGQPLFGIPMVLIGAVVGGLLVSRPANEWINRFPLPFAAGPDR